MLGAPKNKHLLFTLSWVHSAGSWILLQRIVPTAVIPRMAPAVSLLFCYNSSVQIQLAFRLVASWPLGDFFCI